MATLARVPLFPLSTVLFPGMMFPLHIFEERYKQLIAHCSEEDSEFGVLLVKSGSEVGGGAEPFEVGTLARITDVSEMPDGRLNIMTEGTSRFRTLDFFYDRPFLSGDIEILDTDPADTAAPESLVTETRDAFAGYVRYLLALAGQWQREFDLPDEAGKLSFAVASGLKADSILKQRLLEQESTADRLSQELEILERESARLKKLVTHKWQSSGGTGYPVN